MYRLYKCSHHQAGYKTLNKNTIKIQYRGAEKSLVRPGRKQATATEDFDVHISYL